MSTQKTIAIIILVIVVGALLALGLREQVSEQPNNATSTATSTFPNSTATTTPTSQQPNSDGITRAEVAQHASASSCYTIIRGSVYNLTTWISNHPGGAQAILQLCGKDGTAAFEGQHGGSAPQENQLAEFRIGTLVE